MRACLVSQRTALIEEGHDQDALLASVAPTPAATGLLADKLGPTRC